MLSFIDENGMTVGDEPFWHLGVSETFPKLPNGASGFYGSYRELYLLIGDLDKALYFTSEAENRLAFVKLMGDMSFLYPIVKARAEKANGLWKKARHSIVVDIQPDWNS